MSTVVLYSTLFFVWSLWVHVLSSRFNNTSLSFIYTERTGRLQIMLMMGAIPIIALYGWRYGIGADYFAYEGMYHTLHLADWKTYLYYHKLGKSDYYVEIGYFILNKIAPNFIWLQFLIIIIIFNNLSFLISKISKNQWLIGFIFLCTHFVYSLNGTRYILGLSFILVGYYFILNNKIIKYILYVLIASMFHKTFLICLLFVFLKEYKISRNNKIVTILVAVVALLCPLYLPIAIQLASKIPVFFRYFSTPIYEMGTYNGISIVWLFHIIPPALIFVLINKRNFFKDKVFVVLFRIWLLEIPFRYLAFYNPWYGRLARIPQAVEVILVPYALTKIKREVNKKILYMYYIIWYVFYLTYYWMLDANIYISIFNKQ